MRLKEDNRSWKSHGIKRRDFRHQHGDPEIDKTKVKGKKPRPKKNKHKHVWVEVSFAEFEQYASYGKHYDWDRWWFSYYATHEPTWAKYTTYYVCCDCLETKRKVDEGARRREEDKRRKQWLKERASR